MVRDDNMIKELDPEQHAGFEESLRDSVIFVTRHR